jgi:hypothetical protein
VPTDGLLTIDDLDRLSAASFQADDPLAIAAQLVEAAEQERIADPADIGYAYMLASEIHGEADDAATALSLAERAVTAYQRWAAAEASAGADLDAEVEVGWPRAYRARMLFQLGREADAMAELTDLRSRLTCDELAPSYLAETLEDIGRAEMAVEWLTGALDELRDSHPEELPEELGNVVYHLAVTRHRIRRDLDLPHDDYDDVADEFLAVDEEASGRWDQELFGQPVLLWWSREELAKVALRWPELAEAYGATDFDESRQRRQAIIDAWTETGQPALSQVLGNADEFASFLAERGLVAGQEALDAYTDHLTEQAGATRLPPGRNEPCWCGSGDKYKKCCLPRGRLQ